MNNIEFLPITKDAAGELAKLDAECFSVPWSEKAFHDDANNPLAHYVLCYADKKLCGYGGMYKVVDEGQITNIAVVNKYRRCGIASAILDKLKEYARDNKMSVLSLEVRESNHAAIGLYQKAGFEKVGFRKNYYHNPTEGAILMDLAL